MNPQLSIELCIIKGYDALIATTKGTRRFAADLPEDISRTITNLAHLAEAKGLDLQDIIRIAALNYEAERNQSGTTGGESPDSQAT